MTDSMTVQVQHQFISENNSWRDALPERQQQLQLNAPKEVFALTTDVPLPETKRDSEILIEVKCIGLNPIDWKGPAFGFGLPSFPCVLGRDLVGVVKRLPDKESKLNIGDVVLAVSTDYRDYRKAAFQQYAVATEFNICRIPTNVTSDLAASLGVAFVAAALTLGVCLGASPSENSDGIPTPDLWKITRSIAIEKLPEDIRKECHLSLEPNERIAAGDWLAIWGASSTVGFMLLQLAKRVGIKVICIADAIKHGELLVRAGADVLVHRSNIDDAIDITRSVTGDQLRFAVDTVGKDTAAHLQNAFSRVKDGTTGGRRHLVGLTGVPKESAPEVVKHQVPVKLFHESPEIGHAIMDWLEQLLLRDSLIFPKIDVAEVGGLEGINSALGRLRNGSTTAQRIVVPI